LIKGINVIKVFDGLELTPLSYLIHLIFPWKGCFF